MESKKATTVSGEFFFFPFPFEVTVDRIPNIPSTGEAGDDGALIFKTLLTRDAASFIHSQLVSLCLHRRRPNRLEVRHRGQPACQRCR